MVRNAAKAVGTMLAGAMIAVCGLAGSASAATQVHCGDRIDFVTLYSVSGAKYCFADGGALNVTIPVMRIGSGNNGVAVTFSNGRSISFDARYLWELFPDLTVTRICIFNPDTADWC